MAASRMHPDRLLPSDHYTRTVARRLYEHVRSEPILSPHGHVDARALADDRPFADPAELLISSDHNVSRLLHANGVALDRLRAPAEPREIWRELTSRWHMFAGTPVRHWLESELVDVFGIDALPSAQTSDLIYDFMAEALASPAFRPRALFRRFGISVLATTDDAADDLEAHEDLADDPTFVGHVLPTFQADRYMDPGNPDWRIYLLELAQASNIDCYTYAGLLAALRNRREYFIEHGATSTDSCLPDAGAEPLSNADAERIHAERLQGAIAVADAVAYRQNMLYRLAEMSTEDGLVMQLHPGVLRPQSTNEGYGPGNGPDSGHDLPDYTGYSRALQPLLTDFGTNPNLHLVLYTVDEAALSREIGPLASTYPSVFAGTPWWFLDSPSGIARFRAAVTDTAGFAKTSGFVDDTGAFCSIPARHDVSRRADASFLAGLVMTHQISENEAASIATALVRDIPARTFKLQKYLKSAAALREEQHSRFAPPEVVESQPAMAHAHTSAA